MLKVGTRVGPYEVLSQLGAGGMGEVYRARDERLEREVALKVLPTETLSDPTARARLLREARLASQLNHPNICTVHEVGETDGRAYIAMELVEGRPLASLIADGGLPAEQVLKIGQQLADAVAHAHSRGVVHRDLKSGNVIVTPEGRVKVLDFGLAKRLASEELAKATTLTQASLTEAGMVVGTLAYMAPEQLRGEGADARSDVWALGVVFHEMAAGARPFQGNTGYELTSAILKEDPAPLPSNLPAPLAAVIGRCLAKEPGQRYQRGGEVRAALEAAASGETLPPWPALRAWVGRHRLQTLLACASALLALLVGLDVGGVRSRLLGGPGGQQTIRMAVLPFANLSGDPQQEYLSDGLTQEMIAQLGRLHPEALSVIARTSVMRYKKAETPIDQIGRELNVDYVLEGSAQKEGGRVRVSAELIRVKGQAQLWADTFDREMAGILALQKEVAGQVADALALKLLPAEQTRLANAHQVNPEAYDAYLKGSEYWPRLTASDLDTAEHYLDLALEKDPTFAPAHAGLATVWACRQQMAFVPPSQAGPKAKAEARRALELDDTVALAHFAMATVLTWTDWDFPAAGREWVRTIDLDPGDAVARADYSHYLMHVGRPDEAMAQIEVALKADPLNVIPRIFYGVDLLYLRRYEEALGAFREALRMQPGEPAAVAGMWPTLARLGKKKEAFEFAKQYLLVVYQDHRAEQACDEGYAQGGYTEAMKRAAEALAARFRTSFVAPTDIAWFYLEAGDKARALDWLEKGYEVRDPNMPYLGWGIYDGLRSEPRFQALVRKVGLPLT